MAIATGNVYWNVCQIELCEILRDYWIHMIHHAKSFRILILKKVIANVRHQHVPFKNSVSSSLQSRDKLAKLGPGFLNILPWGRRGPLHNTFFTIKSKIGGILGIQYLISQFHLLSALMGFTTSSFSAASETKQLVLRWLPSLCRIHPMCRLWCLHPELSSRLSAHIQRPMSLIASVQILVR